MDFGERCDCHDGPQDYEMQIGDVWVMVGGFEKPQDKKRAASGGETPRCGKKHTETDKSLCLDCSTNDAEGQEGGARDE